MPIPPKELTDDPNKQAEESDAKIDYFECFWKMWGNHGKGKWGYYVLALAALLSIFGLIIFGWKLNVWGYKSANGYILGILAFLFTAIWAIPYFRSKNSAITEADKKNYVDFLGHILIWLAVIFGGMMVLSFKKNPDYFLMLLPAVTILYWGFLWHYKAKWIKPIAYYSALILVACIALNYALHTISPHVFGKDIMLSSVDIEINNYKDADEEQKKELVLTIWQKKAKGLNLNDQEKIILKKYETTLAGKIKNLFGEDVVSEKKQVGITKTEEPKVVNNYYMAPVDTVTAEKEKPNEIPDLSGNWKLTWIKDPNFQGSHPEVRDKSFSATIELKKDGTLVIHQFDFYGNQIEVYEGKISEDGEVFGKWINNDGFSGEFELQFSKDYSSAKGWKSDGGPIHNTLTVVKS